MQRPDVTELHFREEPYPSDVVALREIVASTGVFSAAEVAVALELLEDRMLRGGESDYHFLFAEGAQGVIGYICFGPVGCSAWSYDIYWVAVRSDLHGLGIGSLLLREAEQQIARSGGRRIYIETSSRPDYDRTRAFYHRQGYTAEAILKDFYARCDDKVIFVKELPELM